MLLTYNENQNRHIGNCFEHTKLFFCEVPYSKRNASSERFETKFFIIGMNHCLESQSLASDLRGPASIHMGFVVDKMTLEQFFH
jgi:hypothetical protein